MHYNPDEARLSLQMAQNLLKDTSDPEPLRMRRLLWTFMHLRARALTNGLKLILGDTVYAGPFKGMTLTKEALAAYQSPVLLGCYEHELHPVFERVIATPYTKILNIGCSVGYYAVGLAYRMPNVVIEAFDIDPEARLKCMAMAEANNVTDRVHVSGQFFGENFANYANERALIVMDIEGAEKELLDPVAFPALKNFDIIVELHDLFDRTLSQTIPQKFEATHTIEIIKNRNVLPDVEKILPDDYYLDPYDHLLMGWEGRDGKTPWGVFRKKV